MLACTMQKETTLALLQQMLGPGAQFRDGQWEAIDLAANLADWLRDHAQNKPVERDLFD